MVYPLVQDLRQVPLPGLMLVSFVQEYGELHWQVPEEQVKPSDVSHRIFELQIPEIGAT